MANISFHGIMFHSFHDNKYFKKNPGSLNSKQLTKIIKSYNIKNILSPKSVMEKINKKTIKNSDVCLTFDDALQSQIKIALPILKKFNLKAFFFLQTSIFDSSNNMFAEFKVFRTEKFINFTMFHKYFSSTLFKNGYIENQIKIFLISKKNEINEIKKKYKFYSIIEIKHKLIRDSFLKKGDYKKILMQMCKDKNYDIKKVTKKIYFTIKDIQNLTRNGHYVGLHSHTHPMNIAKLSHKAQKKEFHDNYNSLKKITKIKPVCASYPNGKYNKHTLKIMKNLNIRLVFQDDMITQKIEKNNFTKLEVPRVNASELISKKN